MPLEASVGSSRRVLSDRLAVEYGGEKPLDRVLFVLRFEVNAQHTGVRLSMSGNEILQSQSVSHVQGYEIGRSHEESPAALIIVLPMSNR